MPKTYSSEYVAKVLTKQGFHLVSQKGSHAKFRREGSPARIVIVPMGRKDLRLGTFRSIVEQADMTIETFEDKRAA